MYILFPIGWMYYFGTNLDDRFSVKGFWPSTEQSHKIPDTKEEIDAELSRMRMRDALLRERRLKVESEATTSPASDAISSEMNNAGSS